MEVAVSENKISNFLALYYFALFHYIFISYVSLLTWESLKKWFQAKPESFEIELS